MLRPTAPARRSSPLVAPAPEWDELVPFQRPELPPPAAIMEYYALSEAASFYSNGGPCARLLTERLEAYLGGGAYCIPVSNCTTGLMVALRAACGTPDPRRRLVLTQSYSFTATACAIEWAGYEPVFVDIEPRAWHLDPGALEAALERFDGQVAGVLACATFGTAPPTAQRDAWRDACARHGVPLLLDSAPGFGALDEHDRPLGSQGETEIFSFHATKPFAIGEGGLIVTADPDAAARIARLVNFGLEPGTRSSGEVGFNAKLSELHAATALAMLDRFDDAIARRRASAARLRAAIAHESLTFQVAADRSTWQVLPVLCASPAMRAAIVAGAPDHGIELRTMHDPPLHGHPAFADCRRDGLPVTEAAAGNALVLPMANDLGDAAVERIAALVASVR